MTEDEARQKWCPFARYAHENAPTGGNRIIKDNVADARCMASNCMAWRWDPTQPVGEYDSEYTRKMPENRKGFCGLAGKP